MKTSLHKFLLLQIICLTAVSANYQELPLNQPAYPVSSPKFELGVQDQATTYQPSNIGIIGIRYLHRPGETSTVIEVYPHTPAAEYGIRVGDKILEVNGINVRSLTADDVYALIAGRPGEAVNLKFMRCGLSCQSFSTTMRRMDMNEVASDQVFRIYRYNN
ncbi:MAG: PDZ domain-containing protein [Candidatus Caenarcaniphilales bacterium]|jgi:C-terminal processing protease CtpA/Prc|nr:PDZ domain-containing protein [Candidatus Caenarcaniphilales bacterium]